MSGETGEGIGGREARVPLNGGRAVFGEVLQRHRHAQHLTQAELAEKAGLSERAISDLERGLKHPQRATVRLLIEALGLHSIRRPRLLGQISICSHQEPCICRLRGRRCSLHL